MNASGIRIQSQATRILVVDDTALVSEMVQGLLKELGYEVVGTA
ncbi:MAG TPA: response regulator, partial [Anaerolineae bacterium]|nr:response regulator [Anaerolineae bacterium]